MDKDTFLSSIKELLKGVFIAVLSAIVGILIFALIIKITDVTSSVIMPVNQFIKIISIFLGCFLTLKNSKGLLKGLFIGLISTFVLYMIFSLFSGENPFTFSFVLDLLLGMIIGAVSGVISVNVKK